MIVNRRTFIKKSAVGTCACLGTSAGLTSCISYVFAPYEVVDSKLVVNKADFGESSYVLVKVEQLAEAVFISRDEEDNYTAVLTKCTHKGCEVRPAATVLRCPCHGSEYELNGTVIEGPAEDDLVAFNVETDDEKIYVS